MSIHTKKTLYMRVAHVYQANYYTIEITQQKYM